MYISIERGDKMGVNEFVNIGSKIKKLRIASGYNQTQFAKMLEIPRTTYINYENGHREPSKEMIEKIAAALNVEISDLIGQPITISYDEKEYLIEQLMNKLGYQIIGDDSEGYLCIKYKNAEYEIDQSDLDKLYDSSTSFLEFQLQELLKHSRKIGHKEGE